MKYRVAYRNGKYFAQAKKNWFSKWKRIGEHPGESFGLYPVNDWSYGKDTPEQAEQLINSYHWWATSDMAFWAYKPIKPNK